MKFIASDLDQQFLKNRAKKEAEGIYYGGSPETIRGRSLMQIFVTCLYGQAAEVYLLQFENFTDDERKFKDVFDTNGESVEVKVTAAEWKVRSVLKRAIRAKTVDTWRNFSDILYIFIGEENTKDASYELYGIYHWNNETKNFNLQKGESVV